MRNYAEFAKDTIVGAAAHIFLILVGVLVMMIFIGKMEEGTSNLIVVGIIPFFCAGAWIASWEVRWPKLVAVLSGAVALTVLIVSIVAYNDWGERSLDVFAGLCLMAGVTLPYSLFGCIYTENNHARKSNTALLFAMILLTSIIIGGIVYRDLSDDSREVAHASIFAAIDSSCAACRLARAA